MKMCLHCNSEIDARSKKQKFCNSSCSATFNNKQRVKKQYELSSSFCIGCDKQLMKYQKAFCSSKCQMQVKHDENLKQIESGNVHTPDTLRRYLSKTREHKCEICLGVEWMGNPMPLTMDHIDGNALNNHPSNLRWICPNCDRFTPTFGIRNKGRGRKSLGLKR